MDTDPPGTFDYIWYKGEELKPTDISIFGNKCKENDDTIYPSDHYGLLSEFEFYSKENWYTYSSLVK